MFIETISCQCLPFVNMSDNYDNYDKNRCPCLRINFEVPAQTFV